MRSFRQLASRSGTSESQDLRQRRAALQAELETLGAQRDRDARASSFARSRQRAGVTATDDSELERLADDAHTGDDAMNDLRRRIAAIDDELGRARSDGLAGSRRRVFSWLRD